MEDGGDQLISVSLNRTFQHNIEIGSFGGLSIDMCKEIYKDGRPFSYFIEPWIAENYNLTHVTGCKQYDFVDPKNNDIKYDAKTFTKGGCRFCPSNMLGQGRTFDEDVFKEKTTALIFCIVSNIDFPNIKVRFVEGKELIVKYPTGNIPSKDFIEFFN